MDFSSYRSFCQQKSNRTPLHNWRDLPLSALFRSDLINWQTTTLSNQHCRSFLKSVENVLKSVESVACVKLRSVLPSVKYWSPNLSFGIPHTSSNFCSLKTSNTEGNLFSKHFVIKILFIFS